MSHCSVDPLDPSADVCLVPTLCQAYFRLSGDGNEHQKIYRAHIQGGLRLWTSGKQHRNERMCQVAVNVMEEVRPGHDGAPGGSPGLREEGRSHAGVSGKAF